jgi:uncharacterized membrane protein YedE/YeeE
MVNALLGGALIGLAASFMLLFNGRIAGISGILSNILGPDGRPKKNDFLWRILFFLGLLCGGFIWRLYDPAAFTLSEQVKPLDYAIAGFLVGLGTVIGNGCTSGHGVCGLSRLSIRSLVATVTFIFFGIISVALFKFLRGSL